MSPLNHLKKTLPMAVLLLAAMACSGDLLRREDYNAIVNDYGDREYTLRENIFAPFSEESHGQREVIFKRGERVRIAIESKPDWVRVRAIPAGENQEQNPGRVILYLVRDLLPPEGDAEDGDIPDHISREQMQAELDRLLSPVSRGRAGR